MQETEIAAAKFDTLLGEILARPEPAEFQCRCCGHANALPNSELLLSECVFTQRQLRRFRCQACDAVYGPVPLVVASSDEMDALYSSLYGFYSEGFSDPFQEKTFYNLNPSVHKRYLNYACGAWETGLAHLRSLNWDVYAYEPFQAITSEYMVASDGLSQAGPFDGLMSHNFLEHVQDPTEFFNECAGLLVSGGTMCHSTPCYEYLYAVAPLHLHFFTGQSVQRLAERTGFEVGRRVLSDEEVPGCEYICQVFQKN